MKKKRIEVSFGRTVNVGNYESIKVNATFAADVEPKETVESAYEEAWA